MSGSQPARTFLHVDMDAFFVSVELLRRPELRGQPVVVGGTGNRGVVAAASYEARSFGIRSAMPSVRAQRLCPHAVFLPGDHDRYREVSARLMAIFESCTPHVEPLSLDEAFLDVTGSRRLLGDGADIAAHLRQQVFDQEQLWCSVGVASRKFLAKLASVEAKPSTSVTGPVMGKGVFEVEPGTELAFLHPLPIRKLWGVGPATFARLDKLGVVTVGDLAALPVSIVERSVGKSVGRHLHALSHGIDERGVESSRQTKSISHEETFALDKYDVTEIHRDIVKMADAVATRLRAGGFTARTVTIKVRFKDFETISRSFTLGQPTDSGREVAREAKKLMGKVQTDRGIRLLGVGVSGLDVGGARQLTLDAPEQPQWDDAESAIDDIRRRFGADAIGPAVLADPQSDKGIRVKREGEQQWGPNAEN